MSERHPIDPFSGFQSPGAVDGRSPVVRVMHVDPAPVVRAGVASQLGTMPALRLARSAGDPADAMEQLEVGDADLLLAEIQFDEIDGIEWLKSVCRRHRKLRVLVFTSLPSSVFAARSRRWGARGFLGKEATMAELGEAVAGVAAGKRWFPLETPPPEGSLCAAVAPLTDRELSVLAMLGLGHSTKEMADLLGRSPKTIEAHRANIMRKLGVESLNALLRFGVRWLENPAGDCP